MSDEQQAPIEQLVDEYRSRKVSRTRFIAALTAFGISGTAISTILATAESHVADARSQSHSAARVIQQQHVLQHDRHVATQTRATQTHVDIAPGAVPAASVAEPVAMGDKQRLAHLQTLLDDYAEYAVVEDPLHPQPIVGKAAIAQHKLEEMASMRDVSIDVLHRFVHHDQVVAEWIMRGKHVGAYKGYAATGRVIQVRGVTIATRKNGKIVKESLFYSIDELARQLK